MSMSTQSTISVAAETLTALKERVELAKVFKETNKKMLHQARLEIKAAEARASGEARDALLIAMKKIKKTAKSAILMALKQLEDAEACLEAAEKKFTVFDVDVEDDETEFNGDKKSAPISSETVCINETTNAYTTKSQSENQVGAATSKENTTHDSNEEAAASNAATANNYKRAADVDDDGRLPKKRKTDVDINSLDSIKVTGSQSKFLNGTFKRIGTHNGAPRFRNHTYRVQRNEMGYWEIARDKWENGRYYSYQYLYQTTLSQFEWRQSDPFNKTWYARLKDMSPRHQIRVYAVGS